VKRGVFDVLRRGVDNTIANWPLVLIRLGEMLLLGLLTLITVVVALVPIFVSVGIELSRIESVEDIAVALSSLLTQWILLVWVLVAISALVLIFMAVHSVVEAGSARVYVDGERAAGRGMEGLRSRFKAFTMDRWLSGARDGWWTVFWIYNLAWGLAGLILLIPLLPTMIGMLLFREQPPAAMATGCLGLLFTGLLLILVGAVTGMWVNRAIAEWALRRSNARDSLSIAWQAIKGDVARHLLTLVAVFVVSMAGSSFFASISFFASFGDAMNGQHGFFPLFMMPLRLVGSLLSSAFSAIVSAWYLASYSALVTE